MTEAAPAAVEMQDCGLSLGFTEAEEVVFQLASFSVAQGEQVALTGPSGCGKSTLLNLIAGLRRPDTGKILVQGTELQTLTPSQLDRFRGQTMGFIFQSFNLLDGFSALENVIIGMRFGRTCPHGERHARAVALLERVGLRRRIHSRPAQLSVGERQRVAIARAIANRPAVLLADEPTGALDPVIAADVIKLICEVCSLEKCALLLVTHDRAFAQQLPRQVNCHALVQHRAAPKGTP
jgi:ABC-type lipoprotein export system ATPase subunit